MDTILEFIVKPYFQVLAFLLLTFIVLFLKKRGDTNSAYNTAGIIYILFILINSIIVCFVPHVWPYFFYSLLFSFLYLLTIGILMPVYLKFTKTEGSGESGMIFLVIMYHPIALLIVIFIKWLWLQIF